MIYTLIDSKGHVLISSFIQASLIYPLLIRQR
jgi:hypothetical protein